MNWNGGAVSKSRNTATSSLSTAQKRYFAKARAKPWITQQFKVDSEFSALEHAKKDKLASPKRSAPDRRVDHDADSSKASSVSRNEGGAATMPPLSSSPPVFPISSERTKSDSLRDQKRKLLAIDDWCGLATPVAVGRLSSNIAKIVTDKDEGKCDKTSKKRPFSDPSEAHSPPEGLTGIIDSLRTPEVRSLHNAEEKSYRANKRQRSEYARSIVPFDGINGLDGLKLHSCSLHKGSPSNSVLERVASQYASSYSNSDENLFADAQNTSQPLFQPSPLRTIAYDWSDVKSDAVLSTGSQLDTRSLTDSPIETEPKLAYKNRRPSMRGHPQLHSSIKNWLSTELTADVAPITIRDNTSQTTKGEFLKISTYAPARPELHSDALARLLPEDDIFETGFSPGKFDQHPLNIEPIFQHSKGNLQLHSAMDVETAAMDSIEGRPRVQEVFSTPSPLPARSNLYDHIPHTAATNVQKGDVTTTKSRAVAGSLNLGEGMIGNPTNTSLQSPRTTEQNQSPSPDSGWRDFVIGSADGEISDVASSLRHGVKSQTDPQSPGCCKSHDAFSPSSSPHPFDFLYSEPGNEPSLDQQSPHGPYQHQERFSQISSPHPFSSISSDLSIDSQYTSHAANNSITEFSGKSPVLPPEHTPPLRRHQLASSHYRESTEELEQPAERFVKPSFIFTKPARFVGNKAIIGLSSSTEMGESSWGIPDWSIGQFQPGSRPEEVEEDIED